MPAVKQPCRHHVEGLKLLRHRAEDLLQVRQHGPGKLIHQKGTVGIEHRMGGAQNRFPQVGRHSGIGNTRDHVVRTFQVEARQHGARIRRRTMDHVQTVVLQLGPEKLHEVRVGLQHHQHGVRPHSAQDLRSEGAHTRSVLQKDPSAIPIHLGEHVVDQKAGARYQTPEHFGMFKKIAPKQQDLLGAQ